jgi:dipeptidyl aminopeptidase/acylaminoacyl peptidase
MNFWEKYKKIFIVIGFILIVFILGYLLYALFFKTSPTPTAPTKEEPIATSTQGGLPVAQPGTGQTTPSGQPVEGLPDGTGQTAQGSAVASGGLTQTTELNQAPSLAATLSTNGNDLQYYNKQDGKFYRINKDGQISSLSDTVFHDVEKIIWSPTKNKAILEYPDQSKIIYDFNSNKQISLPKHWEDFDFSSDGSKIVLKSMADDTNNRWLAVINDEGTSAQRIAALGDKDDTVYPSWSPNNQTVAMYTEGVNFDQQKVYFVGLNNENFKALTIEGRGFEPKWSPKGNNLLYSVYSSASDLKPELWIANAQGESIGTGRNKLDIQTWANKCVFSSATEIYCAVPESLEEGAGLFPDLAKNTKDNLYKIDTQTGLKKLVAIPEGDFTMSNLVVSENGYYLYFTDTNTEKINKIKLK